MVNFAIPGMYEHSTLNFRLLDLMEKQPNWFNDCKIEACYGNFQFCLFDGGRVFQSYRQTTKEEIESIVNTYNYTFNIPIRLVFTSNQLKPEHYKDRFCNLILELCSYYNNQIVLVDDNLKDYIGNKYPNYSFISSTTKCITSPKELKKELARKDFVEVCLDYNLNKNINFLDTLSIEEKNKCEFLINAICPAGCPNRKEHYKLNSLMHLNYGKEFKVPGCLIKSNTMSLETMRSANNLSPQEIFEDYAKMNFQHFKLEGRTLSDLENACNYVRYFVKPEYQYEALLILLDSPEVYKQNL